VIARERKSKSAPRRRGDAEKKPLKHRGTEEEEDIDFNAQRR
jgi:hypothetical protein